MAEEVPGGVGLGWHEGAGPYPEFVLDDGTVIKFEVRCAVCHRGLCKQSEVAKKDGIFCVFVKPCKVNHEALR